MIKENPVKKKLYNGETAIGVFCNVPSPAMVEMLGYLGFDFVIIDAEHGPEDVETAEHMIRAAEAVAVTSVSRIAVNLPQNLLRYLDAGSMGVQIPMVDTVAEAKAVVNAAKYPPMGRRGLASVRASGYGFLMSTAEYADMANRETLIVVQVETLESMENIDGISAVDQVDVVFVGPTDLSASLGYVGQPTEPHVLEAIENLGVQIRRAGKVAGTIARDADAYRYWRDRGFQYLATTLTSFVGQSGRAYLEGCWEQEQQISGVSSA